MLMTDDALIAIYVSLTGGSDTLARSVLIHLPLIMHEKDRERV
jgi:hypothetical protein